MRNVTIAVAAALLTISSSSYAQIAAPTPTPTATPTPIIRGPLPVPPQEVRLNCEIAMIAYRQDRLSSLSYAKECVVALTYGNPSQPGSPKIEVPLSCSLKATTAQDRSTCTISALKSALRIPPTYVLQAARSWYFPDAAGREQLLGCIPATLPGPGIVGAAISPISRFYSVNNSDTVTVTHRLLCDL